MEYYSVSKFCIQVYKLADIKRKTEACNGNISGNNDDLYHFLIECANNIERETLINSVKVMAKLFSVVAKLLQNRLTH